jgi:hypothetical protein
MGQQIGQTNTATGIEQAVAGSYAQTEMYFVQHSDHLMPRVHQMRTDLAQYYQATNPSVRLQHMTSSDERAYFQMEGTDLLSREINVYCTTKAAHRDVLEKLKAMATNNNTTGASIYDIGKMMQADSLGTLNTSLKASEDKMTKQRQEDMQQQKELKQMDNERAIEEKKMALNHETTEAEKDRRKDVLVAEIKASGFGAMQDMNQNNQSDFKDAMDEMKQTSEYNETINVAQQKESNNMTENNQKASLKREDMTLKRDLKAMDMEIARENRNQYDKPKTSDSKKKK